MNSDRMKGKTKELEGRALRKVGKITGSKKTQVKGALRQAEGALQSSVGRAKETATRVANRVREEAAPAGGRRKVVYEKTTRTTTIKTKRG